MKELWPLMLVKVIGSTLLLIVAVTAATLGVVGFMWFLVVILHAIGVV